MNPEYYEGIILTTIDRLVRDGQPCGQDKLVELTRLSNLTIIKYISSLERKGRLRVIRGRNGQRHEYKVLDPPSMFDRMALNLHLESRGSHK